jgi:hypothetical protein
MVEVRSLRVIVWSSHRSADEQVAEAIARVTSRYAVDLSSGVEVAFPQDGVNVPYAAKRAINLVTHLRAARAAAKTATPASGAAHCDRAWNELEHDVHQRVHRAQIAQLHAF